jgi:uncharacterized protein (DUF983 family)
MNAPAKTYPVRPRHVPTAMLTGAKGRCPSCGKGSLFARYLKVADHCDACHEALHHHRADDAPPYFTIFIVGHLIVPMVLWVEKAWRPDIAVHMALWLPLAIMLSLALLPIVKGAIVGLQWALYMHGFALSSRCRPYNWTEDETTNNEAASGWTRQG